MSNKEQLPFALNSDAIKQKEQEEEEIKCAALIRMAKILEEYQLIVQKGFEELQKKYE